MGRFVKRTGNASFNDPIPVYVTRPYGPDKTTGQLNMSIWMALLVMMVAWANVVLWGGIALVEAISRIVEVIL